MKWYFASRFRHREKLARVAEQLEGIGQEFISTWIYEEALAPYEQNLERVQPFAQEVVRAILEADVFVLIADADGTDMFVELGIAMAKKEQGEPVRIHIVGEHGRRSLMQLHPNIMHAESLADVMRKEGLESYQLELPSFE